MGMQPGRFASPAEFPRRMGLAPQAVFCRRFAAFSSAISAVKKTLGENDAHISISQIPNRNRNRRLLCNPPPF